MQFCSVITGLVPVISTKDATPLPEMTGTRPVMTLLDGSLRRPKSTESPPCFA
ncbi:MAG: hypothetical protein ACRCUE_13735 [Bosea sp. (in: a-proteobacteria)]